ncbi:MAG TPA: AraC family transcriptional regulator [Terriglobales bacterium]|nr:AraC family transcriptional regulator [Terriglobales bacterium]
MTENREKIEAVGRMQDYIMAHYGEEVTLEDLAAAAMYSPWHALRAFSELTGKTPFEYLRMVRLSAAAKKLRDTKASVLDIALEAAFGSHEGFTKAFTKAFAVSPSAYRQKTPPIPLFCHFPVRYIRNLSGKEEKKMPSSIVFTQVIERPARKFILKRGVAAADYFAYCEEVGCEVWDVLEGVAGSLYEPIGVWLPQGMRKPGTSEYCQGVEVPADYTGPVPEGFEVMDLPPCKYMVFHGEPFEDEDFGEAIDAVWEAIRRYNPELYGFEWAMEAGPRFQLAPVGKRGYIEGIPVRELKN